MSGKAIRVGEAKVRFTTPCSWGAATVECELIEFDLAVHPEPWPHGLSGTDVWVTDPFSGKRLVSGSTWSKAMANLDAMVNLAGGADRFRAWLESERRKATA